MKKVISLFLVMAMLTGVLAVSFNALSVSDVDDEGNPYVMSAAEGVAAYEAEYGEEVETQRIYFQMPNGNSGPVATDDVMLHHPEEIDPDTGEVVKEAYDEVVIAKGSKALSWYNDYNVLNGKHYAGVYWWGGTAAVEGKWVGYRMEIADEAQGIYYVDMPKDVVVADFSNGVDGGTDSTKEIYYYAAQTNDTNLEGAYEGDYESLPYGSPDPDFFDNCIYIVNPDKVSVNAFSNKQECGADWYVYYGNGCYGQEFAEGADYPDGTDNWSDDMQDVCKNPDHFVDGVHVGYHEDVYPTDPPVPSTDEPHTHTPGAAAQENVVPASCSEEGSYDEVVRCTVCGEVLSIEHKTIAKTAHTLKRVNGKPATATTDGWLSHYKCSVCGALFADAAGNIEVTWEQVVKPATGNPTEAPKPTDPPATEPPVVKTGLLGDVDGTGTVDILDVTVIQRQLAGLSTQGVPYTANEIKLLGDVDKDGSLASTDATLIQRWLLGLNQTLKIGVEKVTLS